MTRLLQYEKNTTSNKNLIRKRGFMAPQTRLVKRFCARPNWLDLPQGITELILNKLHFSDQICAFAVCKTWLHCKSHVSCSDTLPWIIGRHELIRSESDSESDSDSEGYYRSVDEPFICEFFDPYSEKSHKVSNSIVMNDLRDPFEYSMRYVPLASKNGWNWVFFERDEYSGVYFLHNPFTNVICCVHDPYEQTDSDGEQIDPDEIDIHQATIKGDPTSPECEIFTVKICANKLGMDVMKRNGSFSSYVIVDEMMSDDVRLYSVLYMNGNVYCLFRNGTLNRHGLEDRSWVLLTSGFPKTYESCRNLKNCWLMEINENIMMVRLDVEDKKYKWMIFRFDWSLMSWAVETSLKSCAIYISGDVAFSTPLKNRNGEILEGCRLFYLREYSFTCYSISRTMGTKIHREEYSSKKWSSLKNPPVSGFRCFLLPNMC